LASPRYQKQITFTEEQWKRFQEAISYLNVAALSFMRDAVEKAVDETLAKKELLGE
jgi:hypothetical protein